MRLRSWPSANQRSNRCITPLKRGNRREGVFHTPGDDDVFVEAMIDAGAWHP